MCTYKAVGHQCRLQIRNSRFEHLYALGHHDLLRMEKDYCFIAERVII